MDVYGAIRSWWGCSAWGWVGKAERIYVSSGNAVTKITDTHKEIDSERCTFQVPGASGPAPAQHPHVTQARTHDNNEEVTHSH